MTEEERARVIKKYLEESDKEDESDYFVDIAEVEQNGLFGTY